MENNMQGTSEWFASRRGQFTASEIEAICKPKGFGATGETYILQRIAESFTDPSYDVEMDTMATKWGKQWESVAIDVYQRRTKATVEPVGFIVHDELPYFGGSPDGIVYKSGMGAASGIIEVKCPFAAENHLKHCMIDSALTFKEDFPKYYWQCVSNFIINKSAFVDFVSFDPRMSKKHRMFIFTFEPPKEDCEFLIDRVKKAEVLRQEFLTKLNKYIPGRA